MQQIAAKRYGSALFEVAKIKNRVKEFLEEFRSVSNIILENKELRTFLHHPNITPEDKKKVVKEVFQKEVDIEILNLLYILIEHDRIDEIRVVYYDFKYLVYEYWKIRIAYVTTAVEMTNDEIEEIRQKLSRKYDCKIEVQNIVKPEIIGGVHLKVGDEVIDDTIVGRLEKMRRELLEQNSEVRV